MLTTLRNALRSSNVFFHLLRISMTGNIKPIFMYLHLTNRCNLNCSYCYANVDDRFHDPNVKDLSTEQWMNLINDSYQLGARYFHLYGGEPLVRHDIDKLIQHCLSLGTLVEIMTNGHLVLQKINILRKVHSVCLSIDGNENENDKVRGVGNYLAVKEAVKICRNNKIQVRLHATINAFNLADPSYLPKLAKEWKTTISYSMPHIPERSEMSVVNEEIVTVPDEKIIAFLQNVRQLKIEGYPIDNTIESLDYSINYPLSLGKTLWSHELDQAEKNLGRKFLKCVFGKLAVIVDSEGYVIKCINHGMRNGLKFQEVGFAKAYAYAMQSEFKPFTCIACPYIQFTELNYAVNLSYESIIKGIKHHIWFNK